MRNALYHLNMNKKWIIGLSFLTLISADCLAGTCTITPGCRAQWDGGKEATNITPDSESLVYPEASLKGCYDRAVNLADSYTFSQLINIGRSEDSFWANYKSGKYACFTIVSWSFSYGGWNIFKNGRGRVNPYTSTFVLDGPQTGDQLFNADGSFLFNGSKGLEQWGP